MAALETGVGTEIDSLDTIFVGTVALFIGVVLRCVQPWTPLPYTVCLLIMGLAMGIGGATYAKGWNYIGPGIQTIKGVKSDFLANLFLPPLLFAGSFGLPPKPLVACCSHIVLLGILGVGTGTCMTAVLTKVALPYAWTWTQAFLFGAVVAATDPVSAIAVLHEVNAPEQVRTVVDGEALVDDGIAAVLYAIFLVFVRGQSSSAGGVVKILCRQSLAGPATGLAFGLCAALWLHLGPREPVVIAVMLAVASFGSYFVSEEIFKSSGILAVVALGMLLTLAKHRISNASLSQAFDQVWSAIEYIANTLIFIVMGIIVAGRIYDMHQTTPPMLSAIDYAYAVVVWLLLLAVRMVNIAAFWPALVRTGDGFSMQLAVLTAWSGIRGVVGLVLALSVLETTSATPGFGNQALFLMSTTIVLTVALQGSTYSVLAKALKVTQKNNEERVLDGGSSELNSRSP